MGSYAIVPLATGASLSNYTVVYVDGTLTVGQATLTVTAANASRAYGASNPVFTATATGAQGSDTFTLTASTAATTSSPVGIYPIVPLATGASLSNYTVVYVNGTLTVGQATLTVTAGNAGRAYGVLGGQATLAVPSMRAKILAQRDGLGVGWLPRHRADALLRENLLMEKRVADSREPNILYVAWHSDHEGRALLWWLEQLRQPRLAKRLIQGLPVPA